MRSLIEELLSKSRLSLRRLGNHKQSACILVYTMHKSNLRGVRIKLRHILHMPRHSIDKRTTEVSCTRMNHHTRLLIYNHEIIILVHHIERDVFRIYGSIVFRTREHQRHHITRTNLVVALHRLVIHMNIASLGSSLNAVARGMLHVLKEELVNSKLLLTCICHNTEMLIELSVFGLSLFNFLDIYIVEYFFLFFQNSLLLPVTCYHLCYSTTTKLSTSPPLTSPRSGILTYTASVTTTESLASRCPLPI